jgi:hypothetical protein
MSASAVARAIPAPLFLEDPPIAVLRERVLAARRELELAQFLDDDEAVRLAWDRLREELAAWRGATGFLS